MAGLYDIPRDDAFYDSLPPLVPKGATLADRERIISEIVEAWCTPLPKGEREWDQATGITLNRVALFDAERGKAIDLGLIVRRVVERVERVQAAPDDGDMVRVIALRGCRVDSCQLSGIDFAGHGIRFQTFAVRFGDGAGFGGATFGDGTVFRRATFGDGAGFGVATFGDGADFESARFGDGPGFGVATFGGEADFWGARFGDGADFLGATFGEGADFRLAAFDGEARFVGATFGDRAGFHGATFGDGAGFGDATFGDGADFHDVRMRGCILREVRINRGSLRLHDGQSRWLDVLFPFWRIPRMLDRRPPYILDRTRIRDTDFHSRARDPWSVLRRNYTGSSMVFILLFTLLAFLPVTAKALFWAGISKLQERAMPIMLQAVEETHDLLSTAPAPEREEWVGKAKTLLADVEDEALTLDDMRRIHALVVQSRDAIASFRAEPEMAASRRDELERVEHWTAQAEELGRIIAPDGRVRLEQRRVIALVLGTEHGLFMVALSAVLILYNVGRAYLTYQIGPMRDHVDQVGISPAWDEYRYLWRMHQWLSLVLIVSVVYGLWRIVMGLLLPVFVPSVGAG